MRLWEAMASVDPVVRPRAPDDAEKVSRQGPDLLAPHTQRLPARERSAGHQQLPH
jgi:hypothetical protein